MNTAEKALVIFDEISRENLHDSIGKELSSLASAFDDIDAKDGKKALEVLHHMMMHDPELVKKHVIKAAQLYHSMAHHVEED